MQLGRETEKRKAGLKSPLWEKRFLNQGARGLFFENRFDDECDQDIIGHHRAKKRRA